MTLELYFEGQIAFGETEEVDSFQCRKKNPHSMKMGLLKGLYRKHEVISIGWTFRIRK